MLYRFLVFAYEDYYPDGGIDDCRFKTSTIEEAIKEVEGLKKKEFDNVYIYDCVKGEIYKHE